MNTRVAIKNVYWDERGWICLELENDKIVRIRPEGEIISHAKDYFFQDAKHPEITHEDNKGISS